MEKKIKEYKKALRARAKSPQRSWEDADEDQSSESSGRRKFGVVRITPRLHSTCPSFSLVTGC